jgi:Lysophospholipase L1 and related esterases
LEIQIIVAALIIAVIISVVEYMKVNNWSLSVMQATNQQTETGQQETSKPSEVAVPENLNTKIVALGDSFTFGYPLGEDNSWPKRLQSVLNQPIVNKGKVRQTTWDFLDRFENDVINEKPGRVIIFAGTGDALRGVSLENYQENIKSLVDKAFSNNITPVLALPLLYPGLEGQINSMREWEQSYAQTEKIVILDFASVLYDPDGRFLPDLSLDGIYPSAKGYELMGDYAASILE